MGRPLFTCAVVLVVISSASALAGEWIQFEAGAEPAEAIARILPSAGSSTLIDVRVPGMLVQPGARGRGGPPRLVVPEAGRISEPGKPDLPVLTYIVAVPDRAGVEVEVVSADELLLEGYDVAPCPPFRLEGEDQAEAVPDASVYGTDSFYPADFASVSEPGVFRDLRIVQVRIYPLRYNPVSRELLVSAGLRVRVNYTGAGPNPKSRTRPFRSEAFEPLYRSLVLNYGELPTAEIKRGSYLVISNDNFSSSVADFVKWKQQRGVETILVNLSDIDPSPSAQDIKGYIQDAYDTWDTPPEYVLLVGDKQSGGYGEFPSWYYLGDVTDHPYAELDGADYFPDVFVGRMAVDSPSETIVAAVKVLSYERDCDAPNDDWYDRALVVAGNCCGSPNPTSPRLTKLRVREMLLDSGYAQVDTVFYPPTTGPTEIMGYINAGVGLVNYRGWGGTSGWYYPDFSVNHIGALANGRMLPVMTSIVCGTGNFDSSTDPCFGEKWIRAGTPVNLKGGPAMCGPSEYWTHTKWNNALDAGIYEGIFFEGLAHFAQAFVRGKMEVYRNFPHEVHPGGEVEFYFHVYNIIGDPELILRTRRPDSFIVNHDPAIPLGQNVVAVSVTDGMGSVVPGAEVIVWKEGESYERRALTGGMSIDMPISAQTAGDADITVWADNFRPYTGTLAVSQEPAFVGSYSYTVDDDNSGQSSGNGDGVVNPGETIELAVTVKNYGTAGAAGVSCSLSSSDPIVVIVSGDAYYGDIPAGATATSGDSFVFEALGGCPDGHEIVFDLAATDGSDASWESEIRAVAGAPYLSYYSVVVNDGGNGVLDPGETATLTVALSNDGSMAATGLEGTLVGPGSGVTIYDDHGAWGTIPSGSIGDNGADRFGVAADASVAVGHEFTMVINLEGDNGLAQFVTFPLVVGTPTSDDPLGPDEYGYFCYDDTDTDYSEAPSYSWIEIDPSYGGSGTNLYLDDDETISMSLPFTFRYYGQDFTDVGVCSNGWVALGGAEPWHHIFRNWIIPGALGPDAMVAGFWDDLDPQVSGRVLYKHDSANHRAIFEWSRVRNAYDTRSQTFEIILYDQAHNPTATGDGEIVMQYQTVWNTDTDENYSTVGIESPEQTDGVLYTFSNIYPDEAAVLVNGRAIKFTTDPPDAFPSTGVEEPEVPASAVLVGNVPNPFNPITTVAYGLPATSHATLVVYDVSGRHVATLFDGEAGAGYHERVWTGVNEAGEKVASGIYFCRLKASGEERTIKMTLLK